MATVLQARFRAEGALAPHAGDRGSELGDSDTEDPDTEDICTDFMTNLDDDFDIGDATLSGSSQLASGFLCAQGFFPRTAVNF